MTDNTRAMLEQALEALEYHSEQTRPIFNTELTIELIRAELAKPVDTDDDPLHPQYIAGFKAGAYAARRRMELDPKTAPSVEIGKHTCPRCKETFSAFVPTPTPAWHDASSSVRPLKLES